MAPVRDDHPLRWAPDVSLKHERRAGRIHTRVVAKARQVSLDLGPAEDQIAGLIDGRITTQQLLARREFRSPQAQAQVRDTLRRLESAGLLHRDQAIEWLAQQAADEASLELQRRLRWGQVQTRPAGTMTDDEIASLSRSAPATDCANCSLSCCRFNVSVGQHEVMPLCQATAGAGWRPSDLFAPAAEQDQTQLGLIALRRKDDGSCVLLDGGQRCVVHELAGIHAKPSPCQLYPAVPVLSPPGPCASSEDAAPPLSMGGSLGLRAGCPHAGVDTSADGKESYRQTLIHLRRFRPNTIIRCAPETVLLDGNRPPVRWADYAHRESAARAAASKCNGAPEATLELTRSLMHWRSSEAPAFAEADEVSDPIRTQAAKLAKLLMQSGVPEDAGPLQALTAAHSHVPAGALRGLARAAQVATYPSALELLRWPTVLAGLGVMRLAVLSASLDIRRPDAERLAYWFRVFDREAVRRHLALLDIPTLEALAQAPVTTARGRRP